MGSETWEEKLLCDLIVTTKDGDWGKENPTEGHLPYHIIRGTDFPDVRVGDLSSVPCRYLPERTVARRTLEPDDILIETAGGTRERPTGRTLLITEKVLARFRGPVTCASFARFLRIDRTQADPRFVFWYLQHLYDQGEMSQHQVQHTGVARFQYTRFAETQKVPLPPLATQKAIAHILGALDDKIELNRRMNATLEGMAKAVFREWFGSGMGASPMCMDGSAPSNPSTAHGRGAHATLPEGWRMGTIGEAFDLTMGQSPPGDTYNEEGVGMPFYQGCTDFGFRFPTRRIYCNAPTRLAKPNDTLVSVRAPVGQLNVATEECCVGRGVAAIRHKSGASSYTYYAVHNLAEHFARFDGEGTVFGSINKKNFEAIPMVIPPAEIIAEYERKARPMDDQILNLEKQSRSLAALRDSLLPKLLSGEISATSLREIP